ncbi:MAG: alpha-2-macroglobulin [Bacteroidales bacterium]|nr:alpha-2-macroglobulin [Bacteroidales bacterium]
MKLRSVLTIFTLVLFFVFSIIGCKTDKTKEPVRIDEGFKEYISAFTSGIVSAKSNIRIKLTPAYAQKVEPGTTIEGKIFSFEPQISGNTFWIDNQTIEFQPEEPLKSGKTYEGKLLLNKLIDVPQKFSTFPLRIQIIKQSFKLEPSTLIPYSEADVNNYKYEGTMLTADYLENDKIKKIINAEQDGKPLPVNWNHDPENKKHQFRIDSIKRKESDDMFLLAWDGKDMGIDVSGSEQVEIPGFSNFKVLSIKVFHQPVQFVMATFSDPLDKSQNLQGLITIEKENNLQYDINNNQVKVFLQTRITGSRKIRVNKAIKNILGYSLKKGIKQELTFEASNPEVRLIGNGIIVPNTEGIIFPFEAINLNAVDVRIVKIYEDNIAQFLQINTLAGDYQLKRVGRLVVKEKIELIADNIIDYGQWNAFSLDLAELANPEPGAIYQVELSFKKSYSLYPCYAEDNEEEEFEESWDDSFESEQSYWDAAENYYYDDGYYYYDWSERDNPCNNAYYRNKKVSRNVLASDLGLIAKFGKNNKLTVVTTDLKTTDPIEGVELEVLSYQQQSLGTAVTDGKGMASIEVGAVPFLLIAKKGNQRGYLKLNDGTTLSLSKFDVSGSQVQKGIKGFIYGERGVWRPGDTLFLTYILEDKENLLPENHPVTFELLDPNGKISERIIKASGQNGFYNFSTITDPDAPTGNWVAKVRIGGAVFTKNIRIETVKPNRLKITLDFGKERLTASAGDIKGDLEVKWLHGAIAKNLKAKVDLTLSPIPTKFDKYAEYIFDDPAITFETEEQTVFEGRIDENGKATVYADVSLGEEVPGMLNAKFFTKVFEEGGNFSVDRFSIPYAPHKTYAGIKVPKGDKARGMLLTDTKHTVEVLTIDANGNPVSVKNLSASVYKLEWRWWWQSGSDNIANYIGSDYASPLVEEELSTSNGYGSFEFEVKYPDWGRYLVHVSIPGGHSTGKTVYIDWPGWAGRAQRENPGGASMLTFSADKDKYSVGDEAVITFPSSEDGRALISLESGAKVIDAYWVDSEKDQTQFKFTVTEEMAPNIYVNITLLQPHSQTVNDLPIRLYGVIPLLVNNPETRINPVIDMPDELKPETDVSITVKEEEGKKMTFTLAVVDEGLLDLTRFITPDPWKVFYAREALSVKTWDVFDEVLGAYGANIEQVFAIGGGGEIEAEKEKKAQRFKPVVKYFGPFTINRNDSKKIEFKMPRYIGSVRTMVIAGNDGAYGFAEKATPVKNPLMILATLPRVISPGEKVKLPATIFALSENIKTVEVELITNEFLKISGANSKSVTFTKPGENDITFDIVTGEKLGVGKIELIAKSGQDEAKFEIEIDVRAPNPVKTVAYSAVLKPNEKWNQDFEIFGIEGTNEAYLEVSGMPPINLERRLRYLIRYPYGCIEQTTSSAFPQLYVGEVMELDKNFEKRLKKNISAAIERLKTFQLSNGGFGYWPGAPNATEWGTSYAGHFLFEAQQAGYQLPPGILDNWLQFQTNTANNWTGYENTHYRNDFIQAYRLYTLALANEPDLGSMNRLKEYEHISLQSKYYLAYAYAISGNKDAARELLTGTARDVKDYKELSYTYGSGDRDRAIILETLLQMEMLDEAMPIIKQLSDRLNTSYWMSTQTTAFCLRAMARTAQIFKQSIGEFTYTYSIGDNNKQDVLSTTLVNRQSIEINQSDPTGSIEIKNTTNVPFYINFSLEGLPVKPDNNTIEKNLKLKVVYKNLDNQVISVDNIEQGTDFKAEFTVHNPGIISDYKELALSTMFPSGWEIHNTRLYGGGETHIVDKPTYQDIRDDRVNTFFDLQKNQSKTFVILLNASYLGEYTLPAIQCSAMYDNDIQARIPGKTVRVVRAGD